MRLTSKGSKVRVVLDQPAVVVGVLNREQVPLVISLFGTLDNRHTALVEPGERVSLESAAFDGWELAEMITYVVISPADDHFPIAPVFELATGRHVGVPDGFEVLS